MITILMEQGGVVSEAVVRGVKTKWHPPSRHWRRKKGLLVASKAHTGVKHANGAVRRSETSMASRFLPCHGVGAVGSFAIALKAQTDSSATRAQAVLVVS